MPPQVLRACDWCHSKKIKCDRKDPCGPCRDNTVTCTRNRPRYPRQSAASLSNDDRFDVLVQRLAFLEDAIRAKGSSSNVQESASSKDASPSQVASTQGSGLCRDGDSMSRTSGRVEERSPVYQKTPPNPPSQASMMRDSPASESCQSSHNPVLKQAEHYFKAELGTPELNINQERQHLFHSGLALAQQVDIYEETSDMYGLDPVDPVNLYSDSMYPSLEFLYVTLNGLGADSLLTQYYLQISSYLSRSTLEQMGVALAENAVHGQRRLEYIVCVNFWIHLVLTSLESGHPTTVMAQHMGGTRDRYADNAKCALKRMSIMAQPTTSTLQALLSGVMLFLHIGDFGSCWVLNAAACRSFVALSDLIDINGNASPAQKTELRNCLFHCYIFDRSFSANMNRPCSLPEMGLTEFVPTSENQLGYGIHMILAETGKGLDVLLKERKVHVEGAGVADKIQRLHAALEAMKAVETRLELVRETPRLVPPRDLAWWPDLTKITLSPPEQYDNFLRGDWMSMEFTYFSTRAALLGLALSTRFDNETYQARLESARRALTALKSMQDNAWAHCTRSMAFAGSLTWTILIFPFLAFFVVFTNVVITADLTDLRLLKEVADGFTVVSADSPTISRIEDFCKKLVKLCFDTITKSKQPASSTSPSVLMPQNGVMGGAVTENSLPGSVEVQGSSSALVMDQATTISPSIMTSPPTAMSVVPENDKAMVDIEKMFADEAEWFRLDGYEQQVWQFLESKIDGFGGVI